MEREQIHILLVEDDLNHGYVVQDSLVQRGYKVHLCRNGKEGLHQFNQKPYHLCVLDVMMPEKDGFSLAKDIRLVNKEVPILFLTARSQDEDKIAGFKSGGDDYITKPFNTEEFLLRVEALLRRVNLLDQEEENEVYQLGTMEFDYPNFRLIDQDEEAQRLTKKEAQVLRILCKQQGKVVPRENILNSVWGQDDYFVGRSLDVFITKLRKYLKKDETLSISNVHGVGFKLEVVETQDAQT